MYSISFEIVGESRYTYIHNNYQVFLSKAYQALDKEFRINKIVKKIEKLDSKELDNLIQLIEDFLSFWGKVLSLYRQNNQCL